MRLRVRKHRGVYRAHIETGADGELYVGALSDDPARAVNSAAKALARVVDHPAVAEILPPGTRATVALLRGASAALARGGPEALAAYVRDGVPASARRAASKVASALRKALPW